MNESGKRPEEIEAEIAATRGELGDTVADIAEKADVKKQVKQKVNQVKEAAKQKVDGAGAPTGGRDGSGGDIGSGPTGDIQESPGALASDGTSRFLVAAAASAFVAGLVVGRILWR